MYSLCQLGCNICENLVETGIYSPSKAFIVLPQQRPKQLLVLHAQQGGQGFFGCVKHENV